MKESFFKSTFPVSLHYLTDLLLSSRNYLEFSVLYERLASSIIDDSPSLPFSHQKEDYSFLLKRHNYHLLELKFWELLVNQAKIEVKSSLPKLNGKKDLLFFVVDNYIGLMREVLMEELLSSREHNAASVVITLEDCLSVNVVENSLKLRTRNASFMKIVVCKRDFKRMLESQSKFDLKDLVCLYCQEKNAGKIPF